ncbi:hypothetical protein GE061_019963 [Apolygus lucorum]|uniref:Uncharacterized protein n=1 Tax=Apolygus lucorum TaxID=248454 RepID=A0A8S9XB45_APOLU|nr:hypothetical protein GE061_019963 [Apolygus lucorum]
MLFASALVAAVGAEEVDSAEDRDVEGYVSDREAPRDVPTRPASKGRWAAGELPGGKTVQLGFVPQKVYTQVRKYDSVKHLPRSAAAAEAATDEEKLNAPRLREVLSQKKIQQVYEEEGYEDMGYDHGGYNHHGSKYEDKEKNEDLSLKKPKGDNDPGSAEHVAVIAGKAKNATVRSGSTPVAVRWKRFHTETQTKRMSFDDDSGERRTKSVTEEIEDATRPFVKDHVAVTVKTDVNGSASDQDSVGAASVAEEIKVDKVGASVEARDGGLNLDEFEAEESLGSAHEEPSGRSMEARVINDPRPKGSNVVTFPGRHTRRQYAMGRPVDVYVQESVGYGVRRPVYGLPVTPANVHHYLPYMPAFPSYYSDNPAAYTAPVVSQRLPVKQIENEPSPPSTTTPPVVVPVLDTGPVQFLNAADTLNAYASLLQQVTTTAAPKPVQEPEQNYADLIQPRFNSSLDVDISASTRMEKHNNATSTRRRPSKFRYPVPGRGRFYNNFTRSGTSFSSDSGPSGKGNMEFKNPSPHTRHPSLPRDSSEDASQDIPYAAAQSLNPVLLGPPYVSHRPHDPVKYIESLTVAHFANGANVPKSPPSVQNERLKELARQLNLHSENISRRKRLGSGRNKRSTGEIQYDHEKYPFYDSYKGISRDSAMRYASNPDDIPKKSPGGMEFYESKDSLVKCDEPGEPDDVVPERDEDGEWNDKPQPENLPRMKGLGESIDCLKLRYFGKDPLDNPFFKEGPIDQPQMYEVDKSIKNQVSALDRKVRDVEGNKRVMIIPSREENSSHAVYNNNYTNSDNIREEERFNGHSSFPYKNHKPESAEVSASVHNLRAHSPYKYYSEHDDSYFPNYEPQYDSETEDSKKHKYYHHNYKHKYVHKTKKRTRPPYQGYYPRPLPVSIYSVIAASKTYPVVRRPLIYSSGSHVIPVYQQVDGQINDNYVSDSKTSYQTTPTRWYIVRPGEYTENKDIANDSKTSSSSIWNYINPLRWWFPAYFDERRGEPKHRRRRSSIQQQEQELFNRILARTNNATLQSRIFDSYKTATPDMMRNQQESTTGQPISINEFKARMNATSERLSKTQSKLNRLTGGFISRNSVTTSTPSYTNTISSPSYGEESYGVVIPSTSPMTPSSAEFNTVSTTSKPKVLFPRTRTPARRRPQPTKSNVNSASRNSLTSTTRTTTTTTTPSTTTRMYKPKRVVKKKFDKQVEAFPVLRRSNKPATTASPFDSVESSVVESGSMEEPRRMQQVEHRRVTKEEVYKTSFIPEEEARTNRNVDESVENYSMSSSESSPVTGPTMDPDNHTLTYMVNPVTGVGSWGEQPRRTTWRPKRKYPKRHTEGKTGYQSTYSYPPVRYSSGDVEQETSTSNRNRKRHSGVPHYDSQAYIAGLMNQVRPKADVSRVPRRGSHRKSSLSSSDEDYRSDVSTGSGAESGSEENPPMKSPPKFILDPGKRKYFYVRSR